MNDEEFLPYPYPHLVKRNHNYIDEKDPYFVLGSVVRTLTVGSLVFLVALSWSEVARISFQKFGCYNGEIKPENDRTNEFHAAIRFALLITVIAVIVSFLVMFYIPGTKW